MPPSSRAKPIDHRVGARLRLRRKMLGLSQQRLADAVGITFQQVQKYERGANRVSASRLHALSRVLDVPVSFFFDDADPVRAPALVNAEGFAGGSDPLTAPETIDLITAYHAIDDPAIRRRLADLAKALADTGQACAGPVSANPGRGAWRAVKRPAPETTPASSAPPASPEKQGAAPRAGRRR